MSIISLDGITSRKEYYIINLYSGCLLILSMIVGFLALYANNHMLSTILLSAGMVISLWMMTAAAIRRCRHLGVSACWTILIVIPYVGSIIFMLLDYISGKQRTNSEFVT